MKKRPSKYKAWKQKQRRLLPDSVVCPPVKIIGEHYRAVKSSALPWEDEPITPEVDELLELGGQA